MKNTSYCILASLLFLYSCGDFEEQTSDNNTATEEEVFNPETKISLDVGHTIFSIPSPVQIALDLEDSDKPFSSELLHDPEAFETYNSDFSKSLMLGIYGTDLAYCSVYGRTAEAMQYFAAMKKMSDELNASYAIDESLLKRFSENIDNKDSLLILASEAYQQIDAYLKENDNHDIAALVLAGGWMESMYFQSQGLKIDTSYNRQQKIAQHKYTVQHFIDLLDKVGSSDDYWELKEMFVDIKSLYNDIPSSYEFVKPVTNVAKKRTVIKSSSSFQTNLEISNQIADEFINLRNFYTE